jgi:2-keto-4-pentenoate hydratase/2-oxohepta-3-ene-1,7-dioic acid hydratase in catechol pathway
MKLALYRYAGITRLGAAVGDHLVDLTRGAEWLLESRGTPRAAAQAAVLLPPSAADFLAGGRDSLSLAREVLAAVERADSALLRRDGILVPEGDVEFLPTLLGAERFICVGRNYLEHVKEGGAEVPKYPVLFSRYWNSVVGHRQPLIRPLVSEQFDYEAELCAVIGVACRNVPREQALEVVGGYTILQEGSIRDWQRRAPTQMAGKNFFHSGSMGPYLVTSDEIPDPQNLRLTTTLNGQTMQDDNTGGMLYDISFLISYITQFMPLSPGDVIATGTPPGVGMARKPPVWMKAGDRLVIEIEGLGRLENNVIDETDSGAGQAQGVLVGAAQR